MKNYRFYCEMPAARGSKSASKQYGPFTREALQATAARGEHINCIAVPLENGQPMWIGIGGMRMDAIACDVERSNAPVEMGTVDAGYLRKRCVRITESLAAALHPRLAAYLK